MREQVQFDRISNKMIRKELYDTRDLMIKTALSEGFTSKKTVELSQRIDELLNHIELNYIEIT